MERRFKHFKSLLYLFSAFLQSSWSQHFTICCLVSHLFLVTIVCSWSPGVSSGQVRDNVTFYDWPSPTSATWAPGVFATNYNNTFARPAAPGNLSVHKIKYWSIQQIQLQLYGLGHRMKHGLEMEHRVLQWLQMAVYHDTDITPSFIAISTTWD